MLPASSRLIWLVLSFFALVVLPAGISGSALMSWYLWGCPTCCFLPIAGTTGTADFRKPFAIAVGASAGLGFGIKPHFLLVPAILELMLWCRARRRLTFLRPETLALGTVVALYAVAIVIFTPGYLTRIVPYTLEVYEAGYHNPLFVVLVRPETLLVPVLVCVHWQRRRALTPHLAAMGDVFSLSGITLFAAYLMQMKGWDYHLYPTTAMLTMLAGVLLTAPSAVSRSVRTMVFAVTAALVGKAALLSDNHRALVDQLLPFVREHAPHSIYLFSVDVFPGFPMAVDADVRWASRFPSLWLMPGIDQRRRAASPDSDVDFLVEIERFTTEAVIADLSQYRPEIVFVDTRPWRPWQAATVFDFIAHFSADPRFAALWARYEQIGEVEGFEVYRLRSDSIRTREPSGSCMLLDCELDPVPARGPRPHQQSGAPPHPPQQEPQALRQELRAGLHVLGSSGRHALYPGRQGGAGVRPGREGPEGAAHGLAALHDAVPQRLRAPSPPLLATLSSFQISGLKPKNTAATSLEAAMRSSGRRPQPASRRQASQNGSRAAGPGRRGSIGVGRRRCRRHGGSRVRDQTRAVAVLRLAFLEERQDRADHG